MLKAFIIGNLGADAKVNRGNFNDFVSLSVAHTRKFTKADGTPINETYWVNVVVNWDCTKLLQYLVKGTKVFCEGTLRTRMFKTKGGEWCAGLDIIADTIELCGSKQADTNLPQTNNTNQNENNDEPF